MIGWIVASVFFIVAGILYIKMDRACSTLLIWRIALDDFTQTSVTNGHTTVRIHWEDLNQFVGYEVQHTPHSKRYGAVQGCAKPGGTHPALLKPARRKRLGGVAA